MTIEVRILNSDESYILNQVANDVFDNPVNQALSTEFLADPRHHIAVAIDNSTVIGMASAVSYIHPDKPASLWINEVGVAPAYRKQGIGKKMLSVLFEMGRALQCSEAWVGTEHDNEAAQKLYVAMNGQAEPFIMYSFALSEK